MAVTIVSQSEDMLELRIEGDLDGVSAPDAERAILEHLDGAKKNLRLDLQGVTYVSSPGLRAFLAVQKRAKSMGLRIQLANLRAHALKVFQLAGFDKAFDIAPPPET